MDKLERLLEAKLMAVENIVEAFGRLCLIQDSPLNGYEHAKEILSALRDGEIKAELADVEASAETDEHGEQDAS